MSRDYDVSHATLSAVDVRSEFGDGRRIGELLAATRTSDVVDAHLAVLARRIGDRMVNIGCGTGEILVEAARRGLSVVGVESESERALQAEERTRRSSSASSPFRLVIATHISPDR